MGKSEASALPASFLPELQLVGERTQNLILRSDCYESKMLVVNNDKPELALDANPKLD